MYIMAQQQPILLLPAGPHNYNYAHNYVYNNNEQVVPVNVVKPIYQTVTGVVPVHGVNNEKFDDMDLYEPAGRVHRQKSNRIKRYRKKSNNRKSNRKSRKPKRVKKY
jgi:hypothetical protein